MSAYPSRILCLTRETTETLYLLGEQDRIAGVSTGASHPPEARRKPRVSPYPSTRYARIDSLSPDLVLGFSDLQADLAAELIRRGYPVLVFNQRSVADILTMIRTLGALVGCLEKAERLASALELELDAVRAAATRLPRRPTVYFEEWDDPLISGVRWIDELVELAGGTPIFPELRSARLARERIVASVEVARRRPEVIVACWAGRAVDPARIAARPGWHEIPAVHGGQIYRLKRTYALPGPASLTEGARLLHDIIARAAAGLGSGEGDARFRR